MLNPLQEKFLLWTLTLWKLNLCGLFFMASWWRLWRSISRGHCKISPRAQNRKRECIFGISLNLIYILKTYFFSKNQCNVHSKLVASICCLYLKKYWTVRNCGCLYILRCIYKQIVKFCCSSHKHTVLSFRIKFIIMVGMHIV